MQTLETATPEQVIEVPKVTSSSRRSRKVRRAAAALAEQIVDNPVPGRGGGGGRGGLGGFSSGQNSTARFEEQNVDIPVPGGGLHDLCDPGGSSSSAVSSDERGESFFFFALFPELKKVRSPPRVRVRGCPPGRAHGLGRLMWGCRPRSSTSSTTALSGSRLGTKSTSVTAGASSTPTTATPFCRCGGPMVVYPEDKTTWSRPGTWSWPCDSFCTWGRSWSCGPCTR